VPVTPTPTQFPAWESLLLADLGAPNSVNNLTALNLWAQSEGSVTNNGLAASGQGAGATICVAQCGSSSPIYEYDNPTDGAAHMAQFLKGSYYTAIVRAFQQDAGLAAIFQAINQSSWCKGCQGGNYPEVLAAAAAGKTPAINPGVGGGGGGTTTPTSAPGSPAPAQTCQWGISVPTAGSAVVSFFTLGLVNTGSTQQICFISKSQWKALSAAFLIAAGAGLTAFGIILLAAWGFDRSGAKQAAAKITGFIPSPAAQAVRAGARRTPAPASSSPARRSAPTPAAGRRTTEELPTVGRRESAEIERQYRETVRQGGPIGTRGGSATSERVAREQRRGVSVPGGGRPRTFEQRQRARERARQPF
jgi:hypothetical protein